MESITVDDLDRKLIQALQIDGRAPFSRIGAVLGVSDQTIARRYRRLRSAGAARVVGQTDPHRLGRALWYVRIRCKPDTAATVAQALARRSDTHFVDLVSGGTEINCTVQAHSQGDSDALLLGKLPRTPQVAEISAHSLLHTFFGGAMEHAALDALTPGQIEDLHPPQLPARSPDEPLHLDDQDRVLLDVLARDGRAGYADLGAATGRSETTTRRRLEHLRREGVLFFDLDLAPRLLGFQTEARLWMSVPPSRLAATGCALAAHPEVAFAAATTGPTNLVAAVICRNAHALYTYLTERLGALTAIQHLETAPVIRTVKAAGDILPA